MEIFGSEKDHGDLPEAVFIDKISITYYQEADDYDPEKDENCQHLEVSTENNGVGRYLTIKTSRWAFDDPEDMKKILEDFKSRALIEDV